MFNPTYRNELRLFRRLTKRVSNACQDCLHPGSKLVTGAPIIERQGIRQPESSWERPTTPKKEINYGCMFDSSTDKENTAPRQTLTWALRVANDKLLSRKFLTVIY